MLTVFSKIESTANWSSAMDARNHFQNGVSLKNQKSRENKSAIILITLALLVLCITAQAQGNITKTAKETLRINERYELTISPSVSSDFKIVTTKDGSLTLSLESFAERTFFALYNEDGASLIPTQDIVSGRMLAPHWRPKVNVFEGRDKVQGCEWNKIVEKFKGSFTFKLDAGTYYLRMIRDQTGLSAANLSIQLKDLSGNVVR